MKTKNILQYSKFILLLFAVTTCLSCLQGDYSYEIASTFDDYQYDCEFVDRTLSIDRYMSEEELEKIINCTTDKINSKEAIAANLIGEWEMVGHIHDVGQEVHDDQACAYLWFTEDDVVIHLEDASDFVIIRSGWEIDPDNLNLIFDKSFLPLEGMNIFCDQYLTKDKDCEDCYIPIFERRF